MLSALRFVIPARFWRESSRFRVEKCWIPDKMLGDDDRTMIVVITRLFRAHFQLNQIHFLLAQVGI